MGHFFYYLIMEIFLVIWFWDILFVGEHHLLFSRKLIPTCTTNNQHFFAKCLFIRKKQGLTISIVEE